MSITTSLHTESESREKNWESPFLSNSGRKHASTRLRLELKSETVRSQSGRSVNRFLLKEEKEEFSESRETIRAKRLQFKALFEAGVN